MTVVNRYEIVHRQLSFNECYLLFIRQFSTYQSVKIHTQQIVWIVCLRWHWFYRFIPDNSKQIQFRLDSLVHTLYFGLIKRHIQYRRQRHQTQKRLARQKRFNFGDLYYPGLYSINIF